MSALAWRAADLVFDPATHTSRAPDGRLVPHVTEILSAVGVTTDFGTLSEVSPRLAGTLEFARARGTAVHADCHAYDDHDLDLARVDPRIQPYVDAWAACRRALGLVPLAHARERLLFHPGQWYAGITDGVFVREGLPSVWRVLADLKTGAPEDAAAHLQTAAYVYAWEYEHPDQPIHERWAIWLRPDRVVPYTVVNYTTRADGHQDTAKFLAALCTFNEQPARRARVR